MTNTAITVKEGDVVVRGRAGSLVQDISIGSHRLLADEPLEVGGTDTGPTPYGLILAGLGACTSMTLEMYAQRKGWPLESVTVRLRHRKIYAQDCSDCETKEGLIDRIEREIELTGPLNAEQKAKLMEIADKCPVHRTLSREINVTTHLVA
jgi:putative redox protein